uniref:Uncharacterized protein n=1 Tax=Bactrocera latifrons TaxID=174628 RepID=A0A0K8ULW5_BACLA
MSADIGFSSENIKEDRFNTSQTVEVAARTEPNSRYINTLRNIHTLRRIHLDECVKHICNIKGKPTLSRFDAEEESPPRLRQSIDRALEQFIPPKSPIERVCRKLFREPRNNRKSTRPTKCQGTKKNFVFKAKNRSSLIKVRRGYLNVARANVIRAERSNVREIQEHFYYKAQELLKDMQRMRHCIQMSRYAE